MGMRVGFARNQHSLDAPIFRCFGQFSPYILSLGKEGLCTSFQPGFGQGEEFAKRRERPRRDDLDRFAKLPSHLLDSRLVHNRRRAGDSHSLAQESRLFSIAFNEVNPPAGFFGECAGNREAGKTTARAEIDPDSRGRGEGQELERIGDVPGPDFANGRGRDQIDSPLPRQQRRDKAVEPGKRFT